MFPSFAFDPPPLQQLGPEWTTWIIILAVPFLAAVVVFCVGSPLSVGLFAPVSPQLPSQTSSTEPLLQSERLECRQVFKA